MPVMLRAVRSGVGIVPSSMGTDALEELHASEWLRHDVRDHAGGGHPLKHDVVPIDAVEDVEVPNTDVLAAARWDPLGEKLESRHAVDEQRGWTSLCRAQEAKTRAVEVDEESRLEEAVELCLA